MRRCDLLTEIREFRAQAVELRECRTLAEEALRLSYQTLRLEMPDTFLGRSRFASAEESLKAPPPDRACPEDTVACPKQAGSESP